MDVKKIVLLIGALVIAAVAAVTARNMFTGASTPPAQAAGVKEVKTGPEVLVAANTLPVGTLITAEALHYQPWPEGLVQANYFVKQKSGADPNSLIGAVVRNEVTAGQPVTQGALIKPGERGFLAAALGPGMRAITVRVSIESSVAGFVFPGDRVDVMLTQTVQGTGDGPPLRVSETILHNIRVLATDQRVTAINAEGKPEVKNFSTMTIEVTPKIAEEIAVAQTIGALSLSLRSIADTSADLERSIASGEVKVPDGDPKAEKSMLVAVEGRPSDTGGTFTVGGDVSRYQRRTVPTKALDGAMIGPSVRVARGSTVTVIPLGAK
jgi:pilus assembly protein CpaB